MPISNSATKTNTFTSRAASAGSAADLLLSLAETALQPITPSPYAHREVSTEYHTMSLQNSSPVQLPVSHTSAQFSAEAAAAPDTKKRANSASLYQVAAKAKKAPRLEQVNSSSEKRVISPVDKSKHDDEDTHEVRHPYAPPVPPYPFAFGYPMPFRAAPGYPYMPPPPGAYYGMMPPPLYAHPCVYPAGMPATAFTNNNNNAAAARKPKAPPPPPIKRKVASPKVAPPPPVLEDASSSQGGRVNQHKCVPRKHLYPPKDWRYVCDRVCV
jgi:hypothetical protein